MTKHPIIEMPGATWWDSKKNESLCCECARVALAEIWGSPVVEAARPDEEDRRNEAVERMLQTENEHVPLEHTLIETYAGQFEDEARVSRLFGGLEESVSAALEQPGSYHLLVRAQSFRGISDDGKCRAEIENWIRTVAPGLGLPRQIPDQDFFVDVGPPDMQLHLRLQRNEPWRSFDQRELAVRLGVDNVEERRRLRLIEAFERKCPKLADSTTRPGPTVLALEFRDVFLTSDHHVTDAIHDTTRELMRDRPDLPLPSHVMQICTALVPWRIWFPIVDDNRFSYPEITRFKFDPIGRSLEVD